MAPASSARCSARTAGNPNPAGDPNANPNAHPDANPDANPKPKPNPNPNPTLSLLPTRKPQSAATLLAHTERCFERCAACGVATPRADAGYHALRLCLAAEHDGWRSAAEAWDFARCRDRVQQGELGWLVRHVSIAALAAAALRARGRSPAYVTWLSPL